MYLVKLFVSRIMSEMYSNQCQYYKILCISQSKKSLLFLRIILLHFLFEVSKNILRNIVLLKFSRKLHLLSTFSVSSFSNSNSVGKSKYIQLAKTLMASEKWFSWEMQWTVEVECATSGRYQNLFKLKKFFRRIFDSVTHYSCLRKFSKITTAN